MGFGSAGCALQKGKLEFTMNQNTLVEVDVYLNEVVQKEEIPGACISIGVGKRHVFQGCYGYQQLIPAEIEMKIDTIFDLASLTKVVSTWPGILMLLQEKQLSLRDRIGDFYSCRMSESVKYITIQNLLTHTSGLSESTFLKQYASDKKGIIVKLLGEDTR